MTQSPRSTASGLALPIALAPDRRHGRAASEPGPHCAHVQGYRPGHRYRVDDRRDGVCGLGAATFISEARHAMVTSEIDSLRVTKLRTPFRRDSSARTYSAFDGAEVAPSLPAALDGAGL